jgi:hypothetical protein
MSQFIREHDANNFVLFSMRSDYYESIQYNNKHACLTDSLIEKNSLAIEKPLLFPKSTFLKDVMLLIMKGQRYTYTFDHCESFDFNVISVDKTKKEKIERTIKDIDMVKYFYIHNGIIEYSIDSHKFSWTYPSQFPIPFEGETINLENTWIAGNLIFTKMMKYDRSYIIRVQLFDTKTLTYNYILEDYKISYIQCLCDENIVVLKNTYAYTYLFVNTITGKLIDRHSRGKFLEWVCPGVMLEYNGRGMVELVVINEEKDNKTKIDEKIKPQQQAECMICMEKINNMYCLVPCGHGIFDIKCLSALTKCPVCRKSIEHVQQIFI